MVATKTLSSEGENIGINFGQAVTKLGKLVHSSNHRSSIAFLIDGLDSGTSIDKLIEFKQFFHNTLFPDVAQNNINLYVVISANQYELCSEEDCIDVQTLNHITFLSYADYKDFILKSAFNRDSRYTKESELKA